MIVNLTAATVRLYDHATPDVIDNPDEGLLATLEPERTTARLAPAGTDSTEIHHHRRTYRVGLVEYSHIEGLPDRQRPKHFLVDLDVALAAPGRGDLLVGREPIHDPKGRLLGYRHLTSPC